MTSYRVASSDRGVGYVLSDQTSPLRPTFWYPYVITSDGDDGITWLPSDASRSFAERKVRDYLKEER